MMVCKISLGKIQFLKRRPKKIANINVAASSAVDVEARVDVLRMMICDIRLTICQYQCVRLVSVGGGSSIWGDKPRRQLLDNFENHLRGSN